MLTRGSCWSVGSSSNGRRWWQSLIARSDRPSYLIRSDGHHPSHLGDAWTHLERPISIKSRSPSDGQDDSLKNSTIAVRSNRDRDAIEPRSWIFHHGISSTIIGRHPVENQDHDRGPIVARSWPDRGPFRSEIQAYSPRI